MYTTERSSLLKFTKNIDCKFQENNDFVSANIALNITSSNQALDDTVGFI